MNAAASTPLGAFGRSPAVARADLATASNGDRAGSPDEVQTQEAFQQFVAGTFYQQMFKALRKGQGKAHYFHGGQTEEIFQAQFDQQVSDSLAKRHGAGMCRSLEGPFLQNLRARNGGHVPSAGAASLDRLV